MRRLLWMTAAAAVLVMGTSRANARLGQQTNGEMDYFPVGKRLPRGLSDFQAFGLFRKESGGRVKMSGWIMPDRSNPDSAVTMRRVQLRGRNLTFAAKMKRGVEFSFDGKFLKSGDFQPYAERSMPVLEGTVRKLVRGRKVAEGFLRFTCGIGG